jgi:NAD(P)H-hydrate epimerase
MPPTVSLYDTDAVRVLEARAMELLGNDAFEAMRRAGRAAWRSALRHWPQAQRVIVVCGPGNNGGDGYVLARHALDSGRDARVIRLAGHSPRSEQARRASEEFLSRGGRVEEFSGALPQAELLVDALFGIGFAGVPDAAAQALIDAMNLHPAPRLALDVPSGVDAARGAVPGSAVRATRTLEFIAPKAGLHTGAALDHVGEVEISGLELPRALYEGVAAQAELLSTGQLRAWLGARRRDVHKGTFGRVLCIGGDHGAGGAIMLCADAALRSGAGLVETVTRDVHVAAILARRPETMVRAVERADDLAMSLEQADVVAVGPGMGQALWGRVLLKAALASGKPAVIDADALNLLAEREADSALAGSILTPHPGEAARLLSTTVAEVQADRFLAARVLALNFDAVVVLKGAGTIVAAPGRTPRIIGAGNPGMAVGGMGDLLTGVIASMRAQGLDPFDAASCGALLHASAGDAAAHAGGERGLLPSDLLGHLRRFANPERFG